MKLKARIMGIGLVVMLIATVLVSALPASAAPPGDMTWIAQSTPGGSATVMSNGSDVVDFVQANTGRVWIVRSGTSAVRSGTSGTVWSTITDPATTESAIAVAPDDENVVILGDATAGAVYITSDGGTNWSTLPALPVAGTLMDVAVGPARSGTLLGREYAIALADPAAGVALGGVYIIGGTAAWAAVAATNGVGDFYHVQFSPGYLGDRILVAGSGNAAGVVGYWLLNTSTNAAVTGYGPKTVYTSAAANDLGGANALVTLDIALPSDFDPTSTPVAYMGFGHTTPAANTGDDVYRLSGTTAVDLNAVNPTGATTFIPVDSVGYAGTQSEGTLFCGYISGGLARVKRTATPTSNTPTWTSTRNNPTGSTRCLVEPNYDFATSNRVNAATAGTESAWSISEDGGVSFHQRSMIDNGAASDWVGIEGVALAGGASYMVTDDGTDLHVWYNPVPPSSMSAKRIYTILGAGDGTTTMAAIKVNPDWDSSPTIVVHDPAAGMFYISNNAGATWTSRVTATGAACGSWVIVDQNTFYTTIGGNFYKTTNQAWTWEAAVSVGTTAGDMYVMADGTILASGTSVRKSTNGGASWATVGSYGASGNQIAALPDTNFADNGIVYTADKVTGTVMRLDVAANTWRTMANAATAANGTLGLALVGGNLYFFDQVSAEICGNPTGATPVWTLINTGLPGTQNFNNMWMDESSNTIYASSGVAGTDPGFEDLWGIIVSAPTLKPSFSSPASGTEIAVDPVTGRGIPLTLSWSALGEGQGQVNAWDIQIWDKAAGSTTATSFLGVATASASSPSLVTGAGVLATWPAMMPNTTYVIRVRGAGQVSGAALKTQWSDTIEVTIQAGTPVTQTYAGPQILGPQGGASTGLNPGFAWAPVAGATKYQFIVATDASLTNTIGGTPVQVSTPSYQVTGLDYGTTYFWAVKVLEPTPGTQTISTFTTMDEPAAPTGGEQPTVVVPTQPAPTVTVNVPESTGGGAAIPQAAIWAIIAIGAVLVVSVLVLIIRTRRPV